MDRSASVPHPLPRGTPWVVAVEMGYGHLRPAAAVAAALSTRVLRSDLAPFADGRDRVVLARMRGLHRTLSLGPELPLVGGAARRFFEATTAIPPLRGPGALAEPNRAAGHLRRRIERGFGREFAALAREAGVPILSTFFAHAVAADHHGVDDVWCLVTDTDANRVWVPADPRRSRLRYCVPSHRTRRRLLAYGVPSERVVVTGFPLPPALVGGADEEPALRNLALRLGRLDPTGAWTASAEARARDLLGQVPREGPPGAPRLLFAVGGAGAQAGLAIRLLQALREPLVRGDLRLTLVAGVRPAVARSLAEAVARHARGAARAGHVEVLHDPTFAGYLERFDRRLADTDLLVTKPSEMVFYGALGLPLLLAPPLGSHEQTNAAVAMRRGFGLPLPGVAEIAPWIATGLAQGTFARAAWAGWCRMPRQGTDRVVRRLRGEA